jgi:hypothetical protein
MSRELQTIGEEYRKASNDSFVSVVRSVGDINKSLLGIASEMTEHSKRSVGRALEMQAQLAKKTYETYISEITKLGQMVFAPLVACSGGRAAAQFKSLRRKGWF